LQAKGDGLELGITKAVLVREGHSAQSEKMQLALIPHSVFWRYLSHAGFNGHCDPESFRRDEERAAKDMQAAGEEFDPKATFWLHSMQNKYFHVYHNGV
jgi:hypothetical protein